MDSSSTFYDNTRLSTYKECPQKYYLRHVLGWRPEGTAIPLIFGLAWHEGMSAMWNSIAAGASEKESLQNAVLSFADCWTDNELPATPPLDDKRYDMRNPLVAAEMYYNYANLRRSLMHDSELLADEQPFAVPIPDMEDTYYVGRLDKVIHANQRTVIVEHKTTSEYKVDGGFKDNYVASWFSDAQVKGYEFAGSLFYNEDVEVWVDAALVHKKVHDAFKLIPVFHHEFLIKEWLTDTKAWVMKIELEDRYPKNESACYGKYGACPFLDICRGGLTNEAEPPPGYVLEPWEPFDILNLQKLMEGE